MITTTTTISANSVTKDQMVDLVDRVQDAMRLAAAEGGDLQVSLEAKWDRNQQPRQDRFKASVKHRRGTY
jgi:hypothetical protein